MKRLALLIALFLVTGVASAQLVFWTTEVQPERLAKQEKIAADFGARTGTNVQVVPVEESELATRITAAFSAGALPDVVAHPISQTIGWAEAGILDTEAATEVVLELGADTFRQGPLDLVRYQGDFAAVPASGWTQLLAYRKDLFDAAGLAAPTSYDAIVRAVQTLGDPPELYGFVAATDVNNDYMMQVLEHFFLANGVSLLDAQGNIDLDKDKFIETLEFYKVLAEASPEGNLYWQQSRELYLGGKAAMIVWSPFLLDELAGLRNSAPVTAYADTTSSQLARNTGFVTTLAGPSNPAGAAYASVSYFGITVDADTEAAQDFVSFLTSDAYLDWLSFAPEGLFPVRNGSADEPDEFVTGWSRLDVGVDRRAPLGDFYEPAVIDSIVAGLDVADRWAYAQGKGALVSRLYGTRSMSELVRSYLDGERDAEEVYNLMVLELESLNP